LSDLRFYLVKTEYLDHLRSAEPKVYHSQGDNYLNAKPYIGVVLEISGHKFLAPLTSPKPKHDKIKNLTLFKIHERSNPDNKLGAISLSSMIPVLESEITELDMGSLNPRYKRMLYKQFEFIKINSNEIEEQARRLYHQVTDTKTGFYVDFCCNFTAMIDASKNYKAE